MSAVDDVRAHLVSNGIVEGATGWSCTLRRIHDQNDKLVVLTEDGGPEPSGVSASSGVGEGTVIDEAVQIYVRAEKWDGNSSQAKIAAIITSLMTAITKASGAIGATTYMRVIPQTSQAIFIGFDEESRPQHSISFRFMR